MSASQIHHTTFYSTEGIWQQIAIVTSSKIAMLTYKILATHEPTYLYKTSLPYRPTLVLCAFLTSKFCWSEKDRVRE